MTDECRHPKCDVCGADARADATPRTEMSDVKRWWVFKEQLLDEKVHRFDSEGAIPVVLASDYDAALARAEKAEAVADAADRHALAYRNELEVVSRLRADADAERDEYKAKRERNILAVECEGLEAENKRVVQDRNDAQAWSRVYQADAKKYVAERDAAVAQVTNRDCQIIALRAERDRLAGVVERVKDLHRWLKESGTHANEALNLGNVLAEPVGSRCDLDECRVGRNPGSQHGYGKCVERRVSHNGI